MRKNEFVSGLSVPEVSSQEVWNIDKHVFCRRVVAPDLWDHDGERLSGGRWLREAAYLIAEDMLANQAVDIQKSWDVCDEKMYLAYVARVGTPNNWRILP